MAAGLRVIRGPDWNLDDNDGGEGHVGTVEEIKDDDTAKITWDGGHLTECRASKDRGYDLRVLDNATVGIRHPHILCDECGESGILGMRWKCVECDDFDLCSPCYFSDAHDCNHQFYLIQKRDSPREKQEKRSKSMKMRVLGIFPDATVVRGKDWDWNDQDGGQGNTGTVLELVTPASHSARSTVKVQWEKGKNNIYRLGYKGKVDLQYTEEAPGIECYPQHLPVFDAANYKEDGTKDSIADGDSVTITVGPSQLQELQKARSGWAVGMSQCIGKVGKVLGFAPNGDAIVNFGNKKYRLNPEALKKVSNITVGSHVRILADEEKVKMMQDGHGGYNDKMGQYLGKVGKVMKIDSDGDVIVKFGKRIWVFAPACCTTVEDKDVDFVSSEDDDGDTVKITLGDNDSGDMLGLLRALAQATGSISSEALFLKATADKEEAKALELLRKEPKLAKCGTGTLTALHVAANRGLLRLTPALVDAGADINTKDKDGDTPLMAALAGGCHEVAHLLIKKGCDVLASNNDGQTASHKSAFSGFPLVLQTLISRGADLNAQDNAGDTPLHDCITKGKLDTAEILLSWPRLDLHRANKKGHPPLHFACMKDQSDIVERIIRKDKTLANVKKNDGFTPLHVCACNDHVTAMRILIEKGNAAVNIGNNEKQSPLHIAANEAAFDCLRLLVQHGADVNGRDGMGNTPLHVTLAGLVGGEQMDMLRLLLGGGNKVREETRTQIACFLLLHGTDPGAKNNNGTTALDACPSTHAKVKETLKKFIADNQSNLTTGRRPSNTEGTRNGSTHCSLCNLRVAQVLFVPCGHRVMCKKCLSDNSYSACPQCGQSIKQMFDQDGKKISQCIVM
ncbi:hypothetical protein ACOMHN_045587 [Nucella lapillus]